MLPGNARPDSPFPGQACRTAPESRRRCISASVALTRIPLGKVYLRFLVFLLGSANGNPAICLLARRAASMDYTWKLAGVSNPPLIFAVNLVKDDKLSLTVIEKKSPVFPFKIIGNGNVVSIENCVLTASEITLINID